MAESKMPFNPRLHKYLITNKFKYTEHIRYDRYDKGDITIFFYPSGYILVLEGGEPASKDLMREIEKAL